MRLISLRLISRDLLATWVGEHAAFCIVYVNTYLLLYAIDLFLTRVHCMFINVYTAILFFCICLTINNASCHIECTYRQCRWTLRGMYVNRCHFLMETVIVFCYLLCSVSFHLSYNLSVPPLYVTRAGTRIEYPR